MRWRYAGYVHPAATGAESRSVAALEPAIAGLAFMVIFVNLRLRRKTCPVLLSRKRSDTGPVIRDVPPHPGPPSGRGNSAHRAVRAEKSALYSAAGRVHPLPKGEDRGEGKETTARRSGNVLDLSFGRCLPACLALSHSRFQTSGLPRSLLRLFLNNGPRF